jgi:hypothetical protein
LHTFDAKNIDDDRHVTMMAIQEKTRSYIEQAPGDDFIPLVIEMYGCFHFCFDSFFPLVH